MNVEARFGVHVKVAPPFDDFLGQGMGLFEHKFSLFVHE
jgi:hypothetical protein